MRGFQPQYVPGPAERGRGNGLTTEDINMRRLRYSVAMSLDGFIAGAKGEYDWTSWTPRLTSRRFSRSSILPSWDAKLLKWLNKGLAPRCPEGHHLRIEFSTPSGVSCGLALNFD